MLRTFGLELMSLINSDPAWKVSKGSRSASRRARRTVGKNLKNCVGDICRSSAGPDMPVSESEKHVPIKKRRFLLRTPSPPPPSSVICSPPKEEIADLINSQDALNKVAAKETASSDIHMSQVTDNSMKNYANNSAIAGEKFGVDEAFSGISILAAAACSSSLGQDCGYEEERSCVEEFTTQRQSLEIFNKTEEHALSSGLLKDNLVISSEMSIGGTSSCVSTEPVGEFASVSTTMNSSQRVETVKDMKDASSEVGLLTLSSDVSCRRNEETLGKEETLGGQQHSSRDDRFHWDLNVMMDAWEHTFEGLDAHDEVSHKKSQDGENNGPEDKGASFESHKSLNNLATTCTKQNHMLPGDFRLLSKQILEERKENQIVVPCHGISHSSTLLSNCKNVEFMKCMVEIEDDKYMRQHETIAKTDELVSTDVHASHPSGSVNEDDDEDALGKGMKLSYGHNNGRSILGSLSSRADASSCGFGNVGTSFTPNAPCVKASTDIQTNLCVPYGKDNSGEVTNLTVPKRLGTLLKLHHDDGNGVKEKVGLETCEPMEHAICILNEKDRFHSSSCAEAPKSSSTKCEDSIALNAAHVLDVGDFQGEKLDCSIESTSNVSEIHPVILKGTCDFVCHGKCKVNLDNSLILSVNIDAAVSHDRCDDISNCHSVSVVGADASNELQEDYESQYEDGELREMNVCSVRKNFLDREAEHEDYGSDVMQMCTTIPTHCSVSEPEQVEKNMNVGLRVVSSVSSSVCDIKNEVITKADKFFGDDGTCDDDNKIRLSHSAGGKKCASGPKDLTESSKNSSDMATVVKGENGTNDTMTSHGDGFIESRDAETRTESKTFRTGLRSRIEGPVEHNVSLREERLNKMESRYEESSSIRSFERFRYPYPNQSRGRQGDSWAGSFDGRRGIKRRYSPIHGPSKLDDDGIKDRGGIRNVGMQYRAPYSHHGPPKNRSTMDIDAFSDLRARCRPDRKFSPERAATFGRGRSFRYVLFDNRIGRGRSNEPSSDESFQPSLKYWHPLSRRERSFSPVGGRSHPSAHHCRGKSPSRSRSRSPILWHSQREKPGAGSSGGSNFLRPRDRSPNFRPDVRVQRLRSPHHQRDFGSDHAIELRSFPRNHNSSPQSRWTSGRKDDLIQLREFGFKQRTSSLERSPGRIRVRSDRADVTDSPRNINPGGYRRFSDRVFEDSAGRGLRYEENYEDRRKHYGPHWPTRRSFEDGTTSRLHVGIDDSATTNGIRDRSASNFQGRVLRGIDRSIGDLPRRLRGEQHSFIYERDGQFNSNSKQFGANVMDASNNLQSEELYQSTHVRFSEMHGLNRGRRFENYEDRRKQYGAVRRHFDMESTEKRLNHNVDENFRHAPDFQGRGLRNFDGRIGTVSTRLGENQNRVACGPGENLVDISHQLRAQGSDDDDSKLGS